MYGAHCVQVGGWFWHTTATGADTLHYELLGSITKEEHQVKDVTGVNY